MSDSDNFLNVIAARHCQRAFLAEPVSNDILKTILTTAANAPSGKNTQPWQVEVISGSKLRVLSERLCEPFDSETPPSPDYGYNPDPQPDDFTERAVTPYSSTKVLGAMTARRALNISGRTSDFSARQSPAFFTYPKLPSVAIF